MKRTIRLILAALVCATAVQAEDAIDVTKYDMHPVLQIHSAGADIAGGAFETDVFIYRGGPTILAHTATTGNVRKVTRGVAKPEDLAALNRALAAAQVGQQRGNCGGPAPDYVSQYALTWYGKQRMRTIPVGGNYTDCPADVIRILDATCEFIWKVLGPSLEICVPPSAP